MSAYKTSHTNENLSKVAELTEICLNRTQTSGGGYVVLKGSLRRPVGKRTMVIEPSREMKSTIASFDTAAFHGAMH